MNKTIIIILSFLISLSTFGQIKIHKNITTKDGLVQGQAMVIRQDSSGYLWIGTYGGVSRWDGKEFMNLTTLNGLTASQVMDIEVGVDGTVYIAPYGGGIVSYKDGHLDTLNEANGLPTDWMSEIHVLKNGDVLFGGYLGHISLLSDNKLSQWIDPKLINEKSIWEIYEARDSSFYLGTYLGGFFHYKNDQTTNYTVKDGLLNESVWSFGESKDGSIYIGTYSGLYLFKNKQIHPTFLKGKAVKSAVYRILDYNQNIKFFATSDGLLIKEDDNFQLLNSDNGLAQNELWSMFIDTKGTTYLGTNGNGLHTYKHGMIETFDKRNGLPDNNIWSISENGNNFCVGTDAGLLLKSENGDKIYNTNNGLSSDIIRCTYYSADGKLYVGTKNGLNIIENGSVTKYSTEDGLIDNQIFSITQTANSDIYLGTREGVSIISEGKIKNLTIEDGLVGNYVQSILVGSDNTIYFGTYGSGLTYFKDGKYKHFTKKNGLTDDKIQTIVEGNDGKIYIGTYEGGLNILMNGYISKLDMSDGLSSNSIHSITIDKDNKLYLTTLKSVNIIDFNSSPPQIRILSTDDGLASEDCNRESILLDKSGNIWFGTKNGLTKYNPKFDLPSTTPPPTYITSLDIYNEPYDLNKLASTSILHYDQNYLKFYFTGINHSSPEKLIFKYKLSGIDKDWVESKDNSVQYTSLDDGNYSFAVSARNEWGYWSEPATLSFTINPAWWETWWFYTLATLSIALLIAFVASYRYRHLLAVEKVRTKISTDLHDNIGSGLTEISFLSEMVKSQVKGNENANKGLNNIASVSKTLIDDMKDIVWLVNPSKDSLQDLFNRLQDSYQEVLKFSEVSLIIKGINNLSGIRLPMAYRQHIFLLFKEAINNSLKYSSCKNININVEVKNNRLVVNFKDDGIGFDIDSIKKGNGLINIEKRAKLVKGEITIDSSPGKGTKLLFSSKISRFTYMEV